MNIMTSAVDKPVILIVDDTPANLGVVAESLESKGYRLLIAQDGTEGLKRAALVKPDLILLDVMMPGMDGFEVCRCLKGQPDTAEIPVIFMTALTESEHKVTGFKVGGVDYLAKPVQIDEVIARVGTHLNLRAMQRQLQRQNQQLQRQHEELEQKVARRTAELSDSNRLLRDEIEERRRVEKTMEFIAQRGWMDGG
ncbi:MAG: response regulator, partial [Gammaproteobacteria bacterium]